MAKYGPAKFGSLGFRGVAALLAALALASPALAQTTADPHAPAANRPNVGSSPNGVPTIDIVKPNGAGVSHNIYTDYNVGTEGQILNNSTAAGNSQLGGALGANPNFTGTAASLILNEVTGGNRSNLLGKIEIFGSAADYILANPNGVTCRGCGFINTPRATLSTGKPILDSNGALLGFDVNGGDVRIEQTTGLSSNFGADVASLQYFDVIARSIMIGGMIKGDPNKTEIGGFAGRNNFDYGKRSVTAKADDGSAKPAFGIDSSALGGAYANKITLIGTEKGVGVRSPADLTAAYGGIELTADGRIVFGKTKSQGAIRAESQSGDIEIGQQVWSETALSLTAGQKITVLDRITAGAKGDVTVKAKSLDLGGGALLGAGLDQNGQLSANGLLTVEAADLSNRGALRAEGDITLTVSGATENYGEILSKQTLALLGGGLVRNESGASMAGEAGVRLAVAGVFNGGSLYSVSGGVTANVSGDLDNSGSLSGRQVALVVGGTLTNDLGGVIKAGETLTIEASSLRNIGADDDSVTDGQITARDLVVKAAEVQNAGGLIADHDITITASGNIENVLGNIQAGGAVTATAGKKFANLSGRVHGETVTVNAESIDNVTLVKRNGKLIIPKEYDGLFKSGVPQKIDQLLQGYQKALAEQNRQVEDKLLQAIRDLLGDAALTADIRKQLDAVFQSGASSLSGQQVTEAIQAALAGNSNPAAITQAVSQALGNAFGGQGTGDARRMSGGFLGVQYSGTPAQMAFMAVLQKAFAGNPKLAALESKIRGVFQSMPKDTGAEAAALAAAQSGIVKAVEDGLATGAGTILANPAAKDGGGAGLKFGTLFEAASDRSGSWLGLVGGGSAGGNHTDVSAGTAEISASGAVNLNAQKDVTSTGGKLAAGGDLNVKAGGNVDMTSTQLTMLNNQGIDGGHDNKSSVTNIQSELDAGGRISIEAGADVSLKGVKAQAGGDVAVTAGGSVDLGAVKDETHRDYYRHKEGFLGFNEETDIYKKDESKTVQTTISSGGKVDVIAHGGNVTGAGTKIEAQGDITLKSDKGNVSILAERNVTVTDQSHSSSTWWGLDGSGDGSHDSSSLVDPSLVSAKANVVLDSGAGDLIINGSVVKAERNIYVNAKNVQLLAAHDEIVHETFTEKYGFFFDAFAGKGTSGYQAGVTAGWKSERHEVYDYKSLAEVSGLVAYGSIIVDTTQDFRSEGAILMAGLDVNVHAGRNLMIETAYDVVSHRETVDTTQVGVTLSAGENVSGAVETLMNAPKDWNAGEGGATYELITQASTALRSAEAAYGLVTGPLVSVNLSVGVSTSHNESLSEGSYAHVGLLHAGRDISLTSGGDIGIQGAEVKAGGMIVAEAAGSLTIQSAQSHIHQSSESEQMNASVGVSAGIGMTGFSASGSVSFGYQNSNSDTQIVTNTNALLSAGGTVTLKSGGDTTVAGAKVEGAQVVADVGGNLKVESRQDTLTMESHKEGFSISLGTGLSGAASGGAGGGLSGIATAAEGVPNAIGNLGEGKQKTGTLGLTYGESSRDRAWTEQQTAIVGTNGVDLKVGANTHLKGALVNSTSGQVAIDTKTFTYEDLKDHDKSHNFDINVNLSHSWGGPEGKDGQEPTPQQKAAAGNVFETTPFKVQGGYSDAAKEGVTRATVGAGTITVRDQAAQQKLEESGKTGRLAALNRDVNKVQEVTRDDRHALKFYVSDTSIKAMAEAAKKAIEYADELITEGRILSSSERNAKKLREELNARGLKEKDVAVCVPAGDGGGQRTWLENLFSTPAYAGDNPVPCIIRFKGADQLSITVSDTDRQALAKKLADGHWQAVMYYEEQLSLFSPEQRGSYLYQQYSQALQKHLDYFALCSTDERWTNFVATDGFLNSDKTFASFAKVAESYRLGMEELVRKYGAFGDLTAEAVVKLRDQNPNLYDALLHGKFENVSAQSIDAAVFISGLTHVNGQNGADGQDGRRRLDLTDAEKQQVVDVASKTIAYELYKYYAAATREKPASAKDFYASGFFKYLASELGATLGEGDIELLKTKTTAEAKALESKSSWLMQSAEGFVGIIKLGSRYVNPSGVAEMDKRDLVPVIDPATGEVKHATVQLSTGPTDVEVYADVETGRPTYYLDGHVVVTRDEKVALLGLLAGSKVLTEGGGALILNLAKPAVVGGTIGEGIYEVRNYWTGADATVNGRSEYVIGGAAFAIAGELAPTATYLVGGGFLGWQAKDVVERTPGYFQLSEQEKLVYQADVGELAFGALLMTNLPGKAWKAASDWAFPSVAEVRTGEIPLGGTTVEVPAGRGGDAVIEPGRLEPDLMAKGGDPFAEGPKFAEDPTAKFGADLPGERSPVTEPVGNRVGRDPLAGEPAGGVDKGGLTEVKSPGATSAPEPEAQFQNWPGSGGTLEAPRAPNFEAPELPNQTRLVDGDPFGNTGAPKVREPQSNTASAEPRPAGPEAKGRAPEPKPADYKPELKPTEPKSGEAEPRPSEPKIVEAEPKPSEPKLGEAEPKPSEPKLAENEPVRPEEGPGSTEPKKTPEKSGAAEKPEKTAATEREAAGAKKSKGCSFSPDTPVLMGDGALKAIAALQTGDWVASRNEFTGAYSKRPVTAVHIHDDPVQLHLTVESVGGVIETIVTTPEHPFYGEGGFVRADALAPGMRIAGFAPHEPALHLASSGAEASGALLVKALAIKHKGFAAWNLTIAEDHTFFVGRSRAWVHNSKCSLDELEGNGAKFPDPANPNRIISKDGIEFVKNEGGTYDSAGPAHRRELAKAGLEAPKTPERALFDKVSEAAEPLQPGKTKDGPALAGGISRQFGKESPHYKNLRGDIPEYRDAGLIEYTNDDLHIDRTGRSSQMRYKIKDVEKVMDRIDAAYKDAGEPLTLKLKALIRRYIESSPIFWIRDGIPGLHAEVRVLNFFQKMAIDEKVDLDLGGLTIATVHTKTGDAFTACDNCTGIIPERVNVYTRTKRDP